MDSTRMPLEVRVSGETIAEIYRARDFFGGYPAPEFGEQQHDREIWSELRRKLAETRSPRGGSTRWLRRWLASMGTTGVILFLCAPALH